MSGVITEVAVKGRDGGDAAADDPWAALQSDYAADGALGGGEAAGTAGGEEVMVLDDETGDATVMAATGASRLATPPLQSDVQPGTTRGGWGEEEDEGAHPDRGRFRLASARPHVERTRRACATTSLERACRVFKRWGNHARVQVQTRT